MKKYTLLIVLMGLILLSPINAEQSGGWDAPPTFWSAYLSNGGMGAIPEEYWGLPFPRLAGEYTFIGGSEPWRGFDIHVETPNTTPAKLIREYWNGAKWHTLGAIDKTKVFWQDGTLIWGPPSDWTLKAINTGEAEIIAYWVRFSVSINLSAGMSGWANILHYSPESVSTDWDFYHDRLSACDNRPGLKMIYVMVKDANSNPLPGVKVGFDTEPSYGIAYDHTNIWGLTDENGYLEWDHLGVPTIYRLYIEDELVAVNIRTDLGNEYCKPPGSAWWSGNIPINRPGIYSYRLEFIMVQ